VTKRLPFVLASMNFPKFVMVINLKTGNVGLVLLKTVAN